MGIMDLFRGGQAPQQVQQTQQEQAAQAAQQQTNGQPVVQPNPAADPTKTGAEVSPLERHKDLWQTNPDDKSAPSFDPNNLFQMDQTKLSEQLNQMDFLQGADPKLLQQVAEGGENAVVAMAQLMNTVARKTLEASIHVGSNMTKGALTQAMPAVDSKINDNLRRQRVNSELQALNPALSSPLAQPIVGAIQEQLLKKHPDASEQEVARMAAEILSSFADESKSPTANSGNSAQSFDWDIYYTGKAGGQNG